MKEDGKRTHVQLDTSPEQLEKMTAELENAPTYRFNLEGDEPPRRVIAVSQVHRDGGVNTATTIASHSLNRKLANYSKELAAGQNNRYERQSVLGEGGTGVVYEMTDHNVGRNVAVKILKEVKTAAERRAFIEEGQLAAKLEHPNIIPIYDMDVDDKGQVFLSMKKVQGATMKSYIDGEIELDLEEIIIIFNKVCDALDYAHSLEKIHQDIKPENMMVGEYGEVFLIDWGAATSNIEEMQISPVYMSPEQARGEMPSVTDDIYCLGASLFHVLTKRFPTNAKTINELWDKKTKGLIDMPTARERRVIPRPLLAIALKAMRADVSQRYQSIKEFADDLKAYLSGFATTAENAGLITQLELLIKRRFREATILLTSVLALSIFGGLYYFHIHQKQAELVKAKLLTYQMEEERKEHWLPVLDQDFSSGAEIDPRLNVTPDMIEGGGVYMHFQSPFLRLEIDETLNSDPKLEITFTCDNIPSLMVGFINSESLDSRFFRISDRMALINYNMGYSEPYISSRWSLDFIRLNEVNTLQCWRRNNTWHATLNGEKFIEYYDSDLTAGNAETQLVVHRHVPVGKVKLLSVRVWNRRPANYISILDRGRQYRLLGQMAKARQLFLDQARYQEDKAIVSEARYLAATCDAGQGLEQRISELTSIANDSESEYENRAVHHLTILAAEHGDLDRALELLERVTKAAPELNTYRSAWKNISTLIKQRPGTEQDKVLRRIAALPHPSHAFGGFNFDNVSFMTGSPVQELSLLDTPVKDIAGLQDLNLEHLNLGTTMVKDLSPLKGKKLKTLLLNELEIPDFSPLKGMSLDIFQAKRHKHLDLSTLNDVSIVKLILDDSMLVDPSPIARTNAKILRIRNCGLTNLDFVRSMAPVSIYAQVNELRNLAGLENQKLTELHLMANTISDISSLHSCIIKKTLDLKRNPISDISPLTGQAFHDLDISETNVEDLSVLRTIKGLTHLKLSGPPPSLEQDVKTWHRTPNLDTIGSLNLKKLELDNAGIQSIDPLRECEVQDYLNLSNNPISDITPLSGYPVKKLKLGDTKVEDLTVLKTLKNLKELDVSITPSESQGKLNSLKGIEGLAIHSLDLTGQAIADLAPLQSLSELRSLRISGTFEELSPLKNLPLESLTIKEARIIDLGVIRSLKSLKSLSIVGSEDSPGKLENLTPLAGMNVTNLNLSYNEVETIKPLAFCKIEGYLSLTGNPIKDISALEDQPIWYLDISYTNVTNVTVIRTMKHLRRLNVIGLSLDEPSRKLLETLPINVISEGK